MASVFASILTDHVPLAGAVLDLQPIAAGLIDLDASFFVQLAVFLVTLAVLKTVLFNPYLKVEQARHDATEGARERAAEARERAKTVGVELDAQLDAARQAGVDQRNAMRDEAEASAAAEIGRTREELNKKIDQELVRLGAAEAGARAVLSTESRRLAGRIADRILGAS